MCVGRMKESRSGIDLCVFFCSLSSQGSVCMTNNSNENKRRIEMLGVMCQTNLLCWAADMERTDF